MVQCMGVGLPAVCCNDVVVGSSLGNRAGQRLPEVRDFWYLSVSDCSGVRRGSTASSVLRRTSLLHRSVRPVTALSRIQPASCMPLKILRVIHPARSVQSIGCHETCIQPLSQLHILDVLCWRLRTRHHDGGKTLPAAGSTLGTSRTQWQGLAYGVSRLRRCSKVASASRVAEAVSGPSCCNATLCRPARITRWKV